MSIKEDIRNQIIGATARANFPIGSPGALLAAFPQGADTKCKSREIEMTAGEAGKLLKPDDFPFTKRGAGGRDDSKAGRAMIPRLQQMLFPTPARSWRARQCLNRLHVELFCNTGRDR